MKRTVFKLGITMAAAMLTTGAYAQKAMPMENQLTEQEKQLGVFTPEVMWKMNRIGSVVLSPDGKTAVYTMTVYDVQENKGNTSLWALDVATKESRRLTDAAGNDSDPQWSADGTTLYFMSTRGGDAQLWTLDAQTSDIKQVSAIEGGIEAYGVAPAGNMAFYVQGVQVESKASSAVYPDKPKSKALIYDDLMARHWDYWDMGEYRHIFVANMVDGRMETGRDIMPGEPWDAPMAPYFDAHEIAWNNAGTQLAYTCKKMTGTEYAVSTDSDIYIYDVASGNTANITEGMVGYDKYPVFSPDDSRVAFRSMERPGNESDKDRLFVHELATGKKAYITADFDYNADNVVWNGNGELWFIAPIEATLQICRADLAGNVSVVTEGDHDLTSFSKSGDNIVATMTRLTMAAEIFSVNVSDGRLDQLTNVNGEIYDNMKFSQVEKRWVETTDGKQMLVWVVLPPDFDPNKKYPALLYCQGGPQSVVSQFWSYRWNLQLMASQGYIVVAPNRRGLPSFGQEWLDQISGDYSGQNIRDYLSAIDDVAREPWADEDRLGCVGASYGGYSVFYLAGHHDKRFKGFISHCGIFDFISMYGSTEELFFINNDYGGSYWSENPVAQRSYAHSPHQFVTKWDTPILIITGLRDFRIPYTQSLEAFTAARLMGIPSKLVAFEDEAHQVFKPQNSLVWNREFFGWLDKYVKGE